MSDAEAQCMTEPTGVAPTGVAATGVAATGPEASDASRSKRDHGTGVQASRDEHGVTPEPRPPLERDNPNLTLIGVAVVAILIMVTVVVVGLIQLFNSSMRAEVEQKQLVPVSSMLREVYAAEQGRLSRYQWIDQKGGVLRIPIERARQLVLADYASKGQSAEQPGIPTNILTGSAASAADSGTATPARGQPAQDRVGEESP